MKARMLPMFGCLMCQFMSTGVAFGIREKWYLFRMSSGGWCPGPDDGSLAETYESQCGQDASVGRLQNLSARRSQSLRCTSVTKLMYTPRHCFVTQCNKTVLCHAAQAGAHVTKLFPAHLNIIPHDFPRRQTIGRHTLSDLRAKRPCPFSPSLVLSLSLPLSLSVSH